MKKNLISAVVFAVLLAGCNPGDQQQDVISTDTVVRAPATSPEVAPVDESKLLGSWVRTDSPYEIRILEVRSDGSLLAGYFNPNSINVGKATWSKSEQLYIYVEMHDQNYPGSNYALTYYPEQDALAGKYFQAVEGVSYDVSFVRKQ